MQSRCPFRHPAWINLIGIAAFCCGFASVRLSAHEKHPLVHSSNKASSSEKQVVEAEGYFRFFTSFVAQWPSSIKDQLIAHAALEHQVMHDDPSKPEASQLRDSRRLTLDRLESLLPTIRVRIGDQGAELVQRELPIQLCAGVETPILWKLTNETDEAKSLSVRSPPGFASSDLKKSLPGIDVEAGATGEIIVSVHPAEDLREVKQVAFSIETGESDAALSLTVPARCVEPALLQVSVGDPQNPIPGRVTVECSDGVCRYGGRYASKSTFTDKPIIYPPIETWQKLPHFYTEGRFTLRVPPGQTRVTLERGFEFRPTLVELDLKPGESRQLNLSCERLVDMAAEGWVSGDTHVHWVTNAWNVDEPLELLSLAQRAEDLRVANNLTLLQRYANQAFIKPSQAPMGPVSTRDGFHVQMGEEYRNEDLYGHLCFLNIDWLVQPIGTGTIIAGPDALDYPINRTAIDACREQGGISIEAHGTGGNKDVPVNMIHGLADSLDQMEPEMYYRLLDCGFQRPLTNGSDHPARPLGIARAYVKVDGPFNYQRWIEGIRRGRTFTTSGPLLFLTVNESEIGDTIHTGADGKLKIRAKVIARDPVGEFHVVSNGEVIASKTLHSTSGELAITIPAEESRWIVARCSNRRDGRADWGFGNFNAITGPGVAHTSPIYVQVDGMPRCDSEAASYWRERMRTHANDIRARGRFANPTQRNEAVGYIETGCEMFRQLPEQVRSARSRSETPREMRDRLINVLRRFGERAQVAEAIDLLADANTMNEIGNAVESLVLLEASVNPESRVKINATRNRIQLLEDRPERFLVSVKNTAGVTAPLEVDAFDVTRRPIQLADWCEVRIIDDPFTSIFLTGAEREYKVVEVFVRQSGLNEARLTANVGQGTQDLGFRATADLLIDSQPRSNKKQQ